MDFLSWMACFISIVFGVPIIATMLAIFFAALSNFGQGTRYDDEEDAYVVMEDGTVRFDTGG